GRLRILHSIEFRVSLFDNSGSLDDSFTKSTSQNHSSVHAVLFRHLSAIWKSVMNFAHVSLNRGCFFGILY
uniref:Uncharacterized protein n=1 Tax=Anopheles atroparvus TaxID=41427 RepID=A0AAG5DU98_ANOAO